MGMGKSSISQERSLYRLEQHCANLEVLLMHLNLYDITLILHDWGGPIGPGFATRHPERIKRLILMNTWAFAPWPGGPFPLWWLLYTSVLIVDSFALDFLIFLESVACIHVACKTRYGGNPKGSCRPPHWGVHVCCLI
jgi:pimeloyl-ACP methyl ester carboxylesterase